MNKQNILNSISELKNIQGSRKTKYLRNYQYYNATKYASFENIKNPTCVGINFARELGEEIDTSVNPQLNAVASCVDTLTSKIAQSKVRPFFNTINGTFKDIQVVKQAQQFFDVLFEAQNVNKTVSATFKDSCIFDTGVIYIDEEECKIKRALPFQVYVRPSEVTYGKITRVFYERKDFPVYLLPEKIISKFRNKNLEYVDFGVYYDTFNKVKAYTANGSFVYQEEYIKDVIPFIFIYYKDPIVGSSSISVVDQLYSIQEEINILMAKIKDASQLNAALTYFVPEGSSVKATQLNNRIGNVVSYKYIQGMTNPIHSSTPAFIDSQYMVLVDSLIQKSYEMCGISLLSAQSKKPTGLDSGVALETMENVESDRFETQVNQVIRTYVDIAKTCIKVFDEDANVLPAASNRISIKWKDIVLESDNMSIQYSAADNLSKDPATKLSQLQQLASAGIIPAARIPQLMQIPDLEMGYSLSNNAIDAVMEIIKECVENDNYDVPEYIPFELLKEEIINTQLSLRAAGKDKNKADIIKLMKLYEIVEDLSEKWTQETNAAELEAASQANQTNLPYNQNIIEKELDMVEKPAREKGDWITEADLDRQ